MTAPVQPTPAQPKPPTSPARRVVPQRPFLAAVVMLASTGLLYLVEAVDQVAFNEGLDQFGIVPREVTGLDGIAFAPLLHGGWAHLVSNTVPLLVFGFLCFAAGLAPFISTTILIWIVSGAGVWLTGGGLTVGASGVIFGWLAFLLVRGVFNRSVAQILVALVLLFYWGGTLFGLLPGDPRISWQAHLFGALGGVLAAWLAAKAGKANAPRTPAGPAVPGNLAA